MELAISLQALRKRYGPVQALQGLDLVVPRGSITALVGVNGAGKSTTLRILLGLVRPDGGRVQILGRELPADRGTVLSRTGALVEAPSGYPYLSGRANLMHFARLRKLAVSEVERVLALVGLKDVAARPYRAYSQGMKQRLAIARAFLGRPELLVLDEPLSALDPHAADHLRQVLVAERQRGASLLISSHQLDEVERLATHLAVIDEGRVIAQGALDELLGRLGRTCRIVVDHPEQAREVLRRLDLPGPVRLEGDALRVELAGEDPADCNTALVQAGIRVRELTVQREDLAQFFRRITSAVTQGPQR